MTRLHKILSLSVVICLAPTVLLAASVERFNSDKYSGMPFAEAVAHNGVLYMSGDIGTDSSGKLVDGGIEPESRQLMDNIKSTLAKRGLGMTDLVKCTVFLADIGEWSAFNSIYVSYFPSGQYPARSALGANGLALGARVEMECIAVLDNSS